MQVISMKHKLSGHYNRFHVIFSDGRHYVKVMLATHLNNLVHDDVLVDNCVTVLTEQIMNVVQGMPIIILLGLNIASKVNSRIGNQVEYKGNNTNDPNKFRLKPAPESSLVVSPMMQPALIKCAPLVDLGASMVQTVDIQLDET